MPSAPARQLPPTRPASLASTSLPRRDVVVRRTGKPPALTSRWSPASGKRHALNISRHANIAIREHPGRRRSLSTIETRPILILYMVCAAVVQSVTAAQLLPRRCLSSSRNGTATAVFFLSFSLTFSDSNKSAASESDKLRHRWIHQEKTAKVRPSCCRKAWTPMARMEASDGRRFPALSLLSLRPRLENSTISLSIRVGLVRTAASFAKVRSIPPSSWETTLSADHRVKARSQ